MYCLETYRAKQKQIKTKVFLILWSLSVFKYLCEMFGDSSKYLSKTQKINAGAPRLARPPRPGPCLEFWVSIGSYKKQPVKKIWARILGLAWLKFVVAPLK
jgi:hypothetical protein